jgi:hypothetical protein
MLELGKNGDLIILAKPWIFDRFRLKSKPIKNPLKTHRKN